VLLRARINAGLAKKRLDDLEREYLEEVGRVVAAAGALEAGSFVLSDLDGVAARDDALGQQARVFQRMAAEVEAREQRLRQEVRQLRIEIDEVKRQQQVNAIVETDFFQNLRTKAQAMRNRSRGAEPAPAAEEPAPAEDQAEQVDAPPIQVE
jgi:hypothetical protein